MNTVDLRCPNCGALARGDAAWCTLCHTDLRPPQAPPEQPPLAAGTPSVGGLDPLTAPLADLLAAVDAGAAAGVREPAAPAAPVAPADPAVPAAPATAVAPVPPDLPAPTFGDLPPEIALALAAAEEVDEVAERRRDAELSTITDTEVMFALLRGQSQDPLLAKYGGRFSSKSSRFAFMVVGAGTLAILFFGVLALLGLVFG